jgi:hypothetical protein
VSIVARCALEALRIAEANYAAATWENAAELLNAWRDARDFVAMVRT